MRLLFGTMRSLIMTLVIFGAVAAIAYFAVIKPAADEVNDTVGVPGATIDDARKLLNCVQRVQPDVEKIQKCREKFPIAP